MTRRIAKPRGVGALSALKDPLLAGIWEFLRRSATPLPAAAVAAACAPGGPAVQEALDALSERGLVDRLPAGRRRSTVTYRANERAITDAISDGSADPMIELIERLLTEHAERLPVAAPRRGESSASGGDPPEHLRVASPLHLDPAELAELRRRTEDLRSFVDMLQARRRSARGQAPQACGHLACIRLEPLAAPVLPLPDLRSIAASARAPKEHKPRRKGRPIATRLSKREWDVAVELVRGLTRDGVAARLGISANTVSTLTKRVYRKLGVQRRAQLADRLRAHGSAAGADGPVQRLP